MTIGYIFYTNMSPWLKDKTSAQKYGDKSSKVQSVPSEQEYVDVLAVIKILLTLTSLSKHYACEFVN